MTILKGGVDCFSFFSQIMDEEASLVDFLWWYHVVCCVALYYNSLISLCCSQGEH